MYDDILIFGSRDGLLAAVSTWAGAHAFVSLQIAHWSRSPRAERDAPHEEHLEAVSSKWAV